jgi:tRNA(Ile)-lysidine synthase
LRAVSDAATRFHRDLTAAAGRALATGEPLALAVSGGPDSMAMLALAAVALPGQVIAATFDHGLRDGSAAEAAMVDGWCGDHGIPHTTLHPSAPLPTVNIQAAARAARYAALAAWAGAGGAHLLATAHHADDQAETFLMRANRGSGPAGLAGIRRRRRLAPGVELVRPLLDWRRDDLAAVAATMPSVDDPSNRNPRFARARWRGWLAGQSLLDPTQLARSAAHVAAVQDDLDTLRDWAWAERRQPGEAVAIDVTGLPRTLCRLLARTAIQRIRADHGIAAPAFTDSTRIEALLDALAAGRRATQGGVIGVPRGAIWHFRPAPPRRTT